MAAVENGSKLVGWAWELGKCPALVDWNATETTYLTNAKQVNLWYINRVPITPYLGKWCPTECK